LEGQLANEQLSRLLVATNFTESDGSRPEAVRLLDTSRHGGGFAGLLGSELLARSLASSALAGGLLFMTRQYALKFIRRWIEIGMLWN
jgi:hypothetical protein